MLGIAWRWQAEVHGGFRPETARRLAALEKVARRDAKKRRLGSPRWHGAFPDT